MCSAARCRGELHFSYTNLPFQPSLKRTSAIPVEPCLGLLAECPPPRLLLAVPKVEDVLQRLGLLRCADVRIGSAMSKGISGGQAKRTNIALALVTNPKVMFLGESAARCLQVHCRGDYAMAER